MCKLKIMHPAQDRLSRAIQAIGPTLERYGLSPRQAGESALDIVQALMVYENGGMDVELESMNLVGDIRKMLKPIALEERRIEAAWAVYSAWLASKRAA